MASFTIYLNSCIYSKEYFIKFVEFYEIGMDFRNPLICFKDFYLEQYLESDDVIIKHSEKR